jgi:hypothetical protein
VVFPGQPHRKSLFAVASEDWVGWPVGPGGDPEEQQQMGYVVTLEPLAAAG